MDLNALRGSEWDEDYERLRRNRMVMGAFRYGKVASQDTDAYDYIRECKRRLRLYEESLNLEYLVDCGNILMLEFIKGKKDGLTLEPIDDGEHNQKVK
jgi:hypothetical protein